MKKKFLRFLFVLGALLGFFLVLLFFTFSPILILTKKYSDPIKQKEIISQVKRGDTAMLQGALMEGKNAISSLKKNLSLYKPLGFLPFVNQHRIYFENLARTGENAIIQSEKIVNILDEAVSPLKNKPAPPLDFPKHIFDTYTKHKQEIFSIQENVSGIAREFQSLNTSGLLSVIQKKHKKFSEYLAFSDTFARQGLNFLELSLPMLGYPEKHTLLILMENNSELRPTGGFIGTYGIAVFSQGRLESLRLDNVYNLDSGAKQKLRVPPPWPLQYFGGITQWFLRDSNWSPNFPDAARQAIWFYEKEGGREKINTVLALTPEALKDLLKILGQIELEGEVLSSENIQDFLEKYVGRDFRFENIEEAKRKNILNDMIPLLQNKIINYPDPVKLAGKLAKLILENLEEKHLIFFSNIRQVQEGLSMRNWAGEIQKTSGDYLGLIDANIGSLKTDPYIERSLSYRISSKNSRGDACSLEEPACNLIAKLEISYKNTALFTWKTTRYRTYSRLYVPYGSELLSTSGNQTNVIITKNDIGKTVFGTFLVIEPQTEQTVTYTYRLPKEMKEYIRLVQYDLLVQKQAGLPSIRFTGNFIINGTEKMESATLQKDTRFSFPIRTNF